MSWKNRNFLLGIFSDEEGLIQAAKELREKNISIFDIHTPFPVHGLDSFLEIKRTRLPIVCFIAASVGCAFAVWFQIWTSKTDWPLNVGGKSFNSFPAFIPVAFEITVLFGALITVAAFFFRAKLFPGNVARIPHEKITDDMFALVLEEVDAGLDVQLVESIFKKNEATEIFRNRGEEWCV